MKRVIEINQQIRPWDIEEDIGDFLRLSGFVEGEGLDAKFIKNGFLILELQNIEDIA